MIETEEVPYGYSIDLSNVDLSNTDLSNDLSLNLIPISVEVVPHKAYLIEGDQLHRNQNSELHSVSFLNFHIFRLSENRINRDRNINIERNINNHQILIQRIKCIFYTLISIPITIILLGYVSMVWERA
jgi:hypothetical protein